MASSIGLDIGGAHLKACLIKNDTFLKLGKITMFKTPIWESQNALVSTLKEIEKRWSIEEDVQINTTMTAEMTDCFRDRKKVYKRFFLLSKTFLVTRN